MVTDERMNGLDGNGIVACRSILLLSLATLGAAQDTVETAGLEWELVQGGRGFTAATGITGASLHAVTSAGDRFVAVGWDGTNGMMLRSRDGELWETVSDAGTRDALDAVAWAGTRFIAVGDNGTIVASP